LLLLAQNAPRKVHKQKAVAIPIGDSLEMPTGLNVREPKSRNSKRRRDSLVGEAWTEKA
jgi:hypothetical protein